MLCWTKGFELVARVVFYSTIENIVETSKDIGNSLLLKILDDTAEFYGEKVANFFFPNFQVAKKVTELLATIGFRVGLQVVVMCIDKNNLLVRSAELAKFCIEKPVRFFCPHSEVASVIGDTFSLILLTYAREM